MDAQDCRHFTLHTASQQLILYSIKYAISCGFYSTIAQHDL